ncbi:hypothetical protein N7447_002338 [Penicillium robsamsonii]|uniref:uncharacterized protein n=1 Tax=Penicillium robsamsonii TaxID=1792511 RepID=UPI0025481B0D|nr:uncharacterized protein N7447_002338 [Penicillium robsamsonii]KAJ5836312.1 hypothetical protein N7447_002338 [Penicillium robsamsonii]
MNDPGLDDTIADEAIALDHTSSSPTQEIDKKDKSLQHDAEHQQAARCCGLVMTQAERHLKKLRGSRTY